MKQRIVITGASGLVGSRVAELLAGRFELFTPGRNELDITDRDKTTSYIKTIYPHVIVHAAAYTDNTAAEKERGDKTGLCWKVNTEGTKHVAEAAKQVGAYVIFLSTGSVFAGTKDSPGPFTERDTPSPEKMLPWYGWTKAVAESFVRQGSVVRLSRPLKKQSLDESRLDYLHSLVKLFDEDELYRLFTDQMFPVTYIDDVAIAIQTLIATEKIGLFHVVSSDVTSPHELARYAIEKVRGKRAPLTQTTFDEGMKGVDDPKRFSRYSALDGGWSQKTLNLPRRSWREVVDLVLDVSRSK